MASACWKHGGGEFPPNSGHYYRRRAMRLSPSGYSPYLNRHHRKTGKIGLSQKLALIVLAAATVILGVVPGPFLELATRAATDLLMR